MAFSGLVDIDLRRLVLRFLVLLLWLVCLRLFISKFRVLLFFLLPWLRGLVNSPKLIRVEVAELKCKAYEC